MARNTIQKKFTTTVVSGIIIEDGAAVAVKYELDRNTTLQTAQAIIRKYNASFSAISVEHVVRMYKMTFEEFKRYATLCDAEAEAEAEAE